MSSTFEWTAILDANILYSAPVRDLLLNIAELEAYAPKWSGQIQKEWMRNLLKNRPDLTELKLRRTVALMDKAFPNAKVKGFEDIINELDLPDANDRHVLAAAIKCKANIIITFNKKDFPDDYLNKFSMNASTPNEFLTALYLENSDIVIEGFMNQLASLRNPPKSKAELIATLVSCGIEFAEVFK